MSDYAHYKVVRYLPTEENYKAVNVPLDDPYELQDVLESKSGLGRPRAYYFEVCATDENYYLDYVLEYSYGEECGEWGKVRRLSEGETDRWCLKVQEIFPGSEIKRENFRVVDYCYYNCCEPPDYFDERYDSFYDEV